jgi:hypothetical protein
MNRVPEGRDLLVAYLMLVSCLAYSLTMNIEALRSSVTSVGFHRATRRYIPEEITCHTLDCVQLSCFYYLPVYERKYTEKVQ